MTSIHKLQFLHFSNQKLSKFFIPHTRLDSRRFQSSSSSSPKPKRIYRYVVDVHGQLFLHDTVPKNMTSSDPLSDQLYQESLLFPLLILTPDLNRNLDSLSSTSASTPTGFKSSQFLDFFFKRLKPNPSLEHHPDPYSFTSLKTRISDFEKVESQTLSEPDWTQVNSSITDSEIQELALKHEYLWLSPCQGEMNFIKALDSPVVFKELIRKAVKEEDEGDFLKWGGSFEMRFQPEKLLVCKESGYLYHPSPLPSSRRNSNQNQMELISPYGPYSLLSSSLVLSNLSDSLELDLEAETGSFVWNDKKYEIGIVDRDRLFEERRRRKEDG